MRKIKCYKCYECGETSFSYNEGQCPYCMTSEALFLIKNTYEEEDLFNLFGCEDLYIDEE